MAALLGVSLAILSGICNGSFGSMSKLRVVRDAEIPPHVHGHWMAEGAGLAGLLVLALPVHRTFTPWGLLSGAMFMASNVATFPAIRSLGLAAACAVWSATAVLASLAWALLGAGDRLRSPALAAAAVLLLLAGMVGVCAAQASVPVLPVGSRCHGDEEAGAGPLAHEPLLSPGAGPLAHEPLLSPGAAASDDAADSTKSEASLGGAAEPAAPLPRAAGALAAVAAGLVGGLVLAPMSHLPRACQGLAYMPSMGMGVLLAAPLVTLARTRPADMFVKAQSPAAIWPGVVAGTVWGVGNAAAAAAAADPRVGLALAYPIMQGLGIAVAAVWGVVAFGELPGRGPRRAMAAADAAIVAGVVLLVRAKGGTP
uniref:Uncharacterized protein n=1 Tax=Auxenochlorella protothecoides TaxID=3075 RepID=A0A1D2A4K7_AUXPR